MRPVDTYLDQYSADHRNATNQWIHLLCVPAIVWSVTAMLWAIPVPAYTSSKSSLPAASMAKSAEEIPTKTPVRLPASCRRTNACPKCG